jgi:hypothetical protein
LVAVPVLPAISPAWLTGNASDFCFRSSGFIFQMASLSGSRPGMIPDRSADAVPVGPMSSGAFMSSVIASETAGCKTRSSGGVFSPFASQAFGRRSSSR